MKMGKILFGNKEVNLKNSQQELLGVDKQVSKQIGLNKS